VIKAVSNVLKQELLPYLDEAIALESECYTIEKILELNAKQKRDYWPEPSALQAPAYYPPRFEPPAAPLSKPERPVIGDYIYSGNIWDAAASTVKVFLGAGVIIAVAAFVIILLIYSPMGYFNTRLWLWSVLSLTLVVTVGNFILRLWYDGRENQKYQHEKARASMAEQQKREAQAIQYYNQAVQYYNETTLPEYNRSLAEVRSYNQSVKTENEVTNAVQTVLQEQLSNLRDVLNKLYALNVIYPKYHNLIALTSFHEYFDSGRCAELEGANGAYNLFETEKRMDIIIYKMDLVLSALNQITNNQYKLYTEMVRINGNIERMNAGISQRIQVLSEAQAALSDGINQAGAYSMITALGIEELSKYIVKLGEVNAKALSYLKTRN
jgi:hypothetical protein